MISKHIYSILNSKKNNMHFGKFSNSNSEILKTLGTPSSIIKWCKNCDIVINHIHVNKTVWLTRDMIGKTFRELGFYFEPFV